MAGGCFAFEDSFKDLAFAIFIHSSYYRRNTARMAGTLQRDTCGGYEHVG
jgi:hypothetical protein